MNVPGPGRSSSRTSRDLHPYGLNTRQEQPTWTDEPGPLLVVLGAGSRIWRGYTLEHIAARHPVALLDAKPPQWARDLADTTLSVDLADRAAVTRAVRMLADGRGVAGVLTYAENHVELAAQLAEQFMLPGNTPAAVAACRDKYLTRSLLAAAGVPSARSYLVTSAETAVEYAVLLDGPVVIKPRSLAGSAGVHRADTPEQVRAAFESAKSAGLFGIEHTGTPGVLVEEYLDGPEISVECVVLGHGTVHIAAVTRKYLVSEPAFLESGHLVDATDPLLADPQIRDVARAALTAVGITSGVMHVEMRLTGQGPRLIEINARLGGDLIPHLVHLATGLNLPQITADLAMGADPELVPSQSQSAAVELFYPPVAGQITTMTTRMTAAWLDRFTWTADPGDHVTSGDHATVRDRIALAVVTGPDPDTCLQRLRQVEDRNRIHIQPAITTTACVA
ncbi:ATP-grasp domain-containing protein [Streptomyces sp. NBC_01304]|uniref:ATP-grasp domain-containing protein n=1 Tax=Streptomyces sp. NBC_01304 TaxID=2903818 RepID=UPI002E12D2D9|nr:ATP-grasp domain-containing protein [Streptomyces sp. NBC_01304]